MEFAAFAVYISCSLLLFRVHSISLCIIGLSKGWNTKRPDKSWNYCALHASCDSGEAHWQPFCQSCFRCKLGGTHQAGWRSSPRHPDDNENDAAAKGGIVAENERNEVGGNNNARVRKNKMEMPPLPHGIPTVVRHQYKPDAEQKAETDAGALHRTKHVLWWFGTPVLRPIFIVQSIEVESSIPVIRSCAV